MFIYGVRSNIPFSSRYHNLLLDIDTQDASSSLLYLRKHGITPDVLESTPRGWHIYVFEAWTFEELVWFLPLVPGIDKQWLQIGCNRGYWFLWTHNPFPRTGKPVQFMRLRVPGKSKWISMKRRTSWMSSGREKMLRLKNITGAWECLEFSFGSDTGTSLAIGNIRIDERLLEPSARSSDGFSDDLSRLDDTYGREFRHGAC